MKASLLLTHYNKNNCLPNTLYSISRQKTTFPLDICFLDDHSDTDPKSIVDEFLPNAKYHRLRKNSGTQFSHKFCMDMMSKDTDVVIILSVDVIIAQSNAIELLCRKLKPQRVIFAEVRNTIVSDKLYLDFNTNIENVLTYQWTGAVYSGLQRQQHWYMFFSAAYLKDLKTVKYTENNCDVVIDAQFRKHNIRPIYVPTVFGIHQQHKDTIYPCKIQKECPYLCYRKF